MKKLYKSLSVIIIVLIASYLLAHVNDEQPVAQIPTVYTTEQLLAEANKLRAEKGVPPLLLDERLNQSAQWKADDMVKTGNKHINSDGTRGFSKVYEYAPDTCRIAGENLSTTFGYSNPFNNMDGWPTSKGHYESIIDPRFESTGFGIVVSGSHINYVQHFCDLK